MIRFLPGVLFVAACTTELAQSYTYTEAETGSDILVSGTVPEHIDLDTVVRDMSPGSIALLGNADSDSVAVVQSLTDDRTGTVSFTAGAASCPDCNTGCAGATERTVEVGLTPVGAGPFVATETETLSAANFVLPSTFGWTPAVGVEETVSITGNYGACSEFAYIFDTIDGPDFPFEERNDQIDAGDTIVAGVADSTVQTRLTAASATSISRVLFFVEAAVPASCTVSPVVHDQTGAIVGSGAVVTPIMGTTDLALDLPVTLAAGEFYDVGVVVTACGINDGTGDLTYRRSLESTLGPVVFNRATIGFFIGMWAE